MCNWGNTYVMNQVQRFVDTNITQVAIGLRISNRAELIWDSGWVVGARMDPLKGIVVCALEIMQIVEKNV